MGRAYIDGYFTIPQMFVAEAFRRTQKDIEGITPEDFFREAYISALEVDEKTGDFIFGASYGDEYEVSDYIDEFIRKVWDLIEGDSFFLKVIWMDGSDVVWVFEKDKLSGDLGYTLKQYVSETRLKLDTLTLANENFSNQKTMNETSIKEIFGNDIFYKDE